MPFKNAGSCSLISITRLTEEQYAERVNIWNDFRLRHPDASGSNVKYFQSFMSEPGYAHYIYYGQMSQELIDITPLELSMVCDGGFSYFGGQVNLSSDGSFSVKIYTD